MPISRRDFVKATAVAAAATQLPATLRAAMAQTPVNLSPVSLHWLDGRVPIAQPGTAFGVPWPRGVLDKSTAFALHTEAGEAVPVQTWPMAYWPDGTLKWTGHAIAAESARAPSLRIAPSRPAIPATAVSVEETSDAIVLRTAQLDIRVPKRGAAIIASIARDGREVARDARLVCFRQDRPSFSGGETATREEFTGEVSSVTIEQRGPVRAVVKIEGKHVNAAGRTWLPFVVRLYVHADGDAVRFVHTFIFDGDQAKDFICGLGLRCAVPLREELHNRHVRLAGEDSGAWSEAVRNIPGWATRTTFAFSNLAPDQLEGKPCPPLASWDAKSRTQFEGLPAWDSFTLAQSSADHFDVRKRTGVHSSWVKSGHGRRASGLAYVGDTSGGVAFGLRNFWQMHPTQIDVQGAATDLAHITTWLWSPDAPPMDLRHYSDRAHGLDISYEDWEEGHSTPMGVARTSEFLLWALPATPTRARFVELADALRAPSRLVCAPQHYHACRVFGIWSLPDRSTPAKARLEGEFDRIVAFYQREVESQQWYGFWNFGDIMHSYDEQRHVWRYDVGGYAWANSEMVPDMWLWYAFLRSGRADIFRFAEAMTRHTSEVDMHHLGPFAPLGSRHNVSHWGCGAKEPRITMAGLRRFYYYLTTDERTGDLMRDVVNVDHALVRIDPLRKLLPKSQWPTHARSGPDWFAFCSNWITEWERTGDTRWRDKIIAGMDSLAAMPHGMFSGPNFGYDPATGTLHDVGDIEKANWLMLAIFGGAETVFEMLELIEHPAWERAWLQCCELWNAPVDAREKVTGRKFATGIYPIWYSRLTAYAAYRRGDAQLARRAWSEFLQGQHRDERRRIPINARRIEGPAILEPREELWWIETNHASQWSLNLIENLAMIGEHLPEKLEGVWQEG